jgi:pimeloyl-ACP methyl ester carboxylesterase
VAQPTPSGQDFHSFQSYREWQTKALGYAFPESELRNGFATNNDGSMGHFRTPPDVFRSVAEGTQKREYGSLTLPVLAIFAVPARPEEIVSLTYKPRDAREQSALDANYKSILKYIQVDEKSIYSAHNAQVIELKGADHYVFLTQSAAVIQDLRNFLAGLH